MTTMRVPLYLSGAVRREIAGRPGFGYMKTPRMGNKIPAGSTWFADNGCFSPSGEREFDLDRYLAFLRSQDSRTCLGATAPDKVGDAAETLRRSLPVLPQIRAIGYKAALVAQDGLELLPVPWGAFDVLFIGGSTEWKLSPMAAGLIAEAKQRGKWVHMGRVNSFKRFAYAMLAGCDSVDGTYLAFAPDVNLRNLESWILRLNSIAEKNNNEGGNEEPSGQTPIPGPDAPGLPGPGERPGHRPENSVWGRGGPGVLGCNPGKQPPPKRRNGNGDPLQLEMFTQASCDGPPN